jgi:hypothetical protein
MGRTKMLCPSVFSLSVLLMVSVVCAQSAPPSAVTVTPQALRGIARSLDSQAREAGGYGQAQTEYKDFCQVIVVPAEEPPSVRIAQSAGSFTISSTFEPSFTPPQRAVIQRALDEWQEFILTHGLHPGNCSIDFHYWPLGWGRRSVTQLYFDSVSGNPVGAKIVFDSSDTMWFVDPSPEDDAEFDDTPPPGVDLLTVARHEIAHAIGWSFNPAVNKLMAGRIFDPLRLNIATTYTDDELHTDPNVYVNDLMLPSIPSSTRRSICLYPHCALLARAFNCDIPMRFVDGGFAGSEGRSGSANAPWNTVFEAIGLVPWNYNLLMIPRTYSEPVPLRLDKPVVISAARGGEVVITGP